MVTWSKLLLPSQRFCILFGKNARSPGLTHVPSRTCKTIVKGAKFHIVNSSYTWNKFKDLMNFYFLLTFIPTLGVIMYTNIFIGPATLEPIPEGYRPKRWEYHSHPITRFICKYLTEEPQKWYEKMCFALYHENETILLKHIERNVKGLINERRDFQAWYYSPPMTKYTHFRNKILEDVDHNVVFPLLA